jgi:hypothetical protein
MPQTTVGVAAPIRNIKSGSNPQALAASDLKNEPISVYFFADAISDLTDVVPESHLPTFQPCY